MTENRLYRSRTSKVFAGVCGGLGEYFHLNPMFFRILFVLFFHSFWIVYVILYLCTPQRPQK